jgi:hypothetical protein
MTKVRPNMILGQLSQQLDIVMLSSMNTSKPASIAFFVILIVLLVGACGPILPEQGSNETVTSVPTFTLIPPIITQTSPPEFVTVPATVMPIQPPPPILTPDAIQVERWQEYQTELAKVLLLHSAGSRQHALCEWDILGRTDQEVYVWAYCAGQGGQGGNSEFAVIYLALDGSIQEVSTVSQDVKESDLFPEDVRAKFELYRTSSFYGRARDLVDHRRHRDTHPEEPPVVVFSAMPLATVMPTQTLIPMITSDSVQVGRWRGYQAALAMELVSVRPAETVLWEWEILGRGELELYVWVVCVASGYEATHPAVIHLKADGSIQNVEVPLVGSASEADLNRMFPADVREKIVSYDPAGRLQEMFNHIKWRQAHPEEPPLIVRSTMPTLTPTP